jgi:hypothetical protein
MATAEGAQGHAEHWSSALLQAPSFLSAHFLMPPKEKIKGNCQQKGHILHCSNCKHEQMKFSRYQNPNSLVDL